MTALALDLPSAVAGASLSAASDLVIQTQCFGAIRAASEDLLTFAAGMYGFPDCHQFVLLPAGDDLWWLQSAEHASLFFLLADPFPAVPGYAVDLGPVDRMALGAHEPEEIAVFAVVNLRPGHQATINLQGPIAINLRTRQGRQLAIADSAYGVSAPFTMPPLR
ncbi:MAG: flagellar assembly protein FliW [Gemmatimonadaceae bacterium]